MQKLLKNIKGDLQANTISASTLDINASTGLNSEHYLIMEVRAVGKQGLYDDSGIKYNPSTDTLTTTAIVNANLNGNSSESADKITL